MLISLASTILAAQLAVAPLSALAPVPAPPGMRASTSGIDIVWETSYEAALERAAREQRPIFVAVSVDDVHACEQLIDDVYGDRTLEGLTAHTVNLMASDSTHSENAKSCPRFGGPSCREHRYVDAAVREALLAPSENGAYVAPQHLFLAPDGALILSVPYEVSAGELEWCLLEALATVDPEVALEPSKHARMPRRLIYGDVLPIGPNTALPVTRAQALTWLEEHRRGLGREEGWELLRMLSIADEPEAHEYIEARLRSNTSNAGGGRGGSSPGGLRNDPRDRRPQLLRWMGNVSPPGYAPVILEFLDSSDEALRVEAIVALEQLGSPEALAALTKELRGEQDPAIAKNLLRAIGASARADKKARKLLLDQASDDREPLLRINAIVALGLLDQHADVDALLASALRDESPTVRSAAAIAIGITRNRDWIEVCQAALQDALSAESGSEAASEQPIEALEAALEVLAGAQLYTLRPLLAKVAEDQIPRSRLFGGGSVERGGGRTGNGRDEELRD